MSKIYVARSPKFGKWASDVGLSKHVFKIGIADEPVKSLVEAGWGGEVDWTLLDVQDAEGRTEAEIIVQVARKERMIDPKLYPKVKGGEGFFKVSPTNVENHIVLTKALAGQEHRSDVKLKPADFAAYLIQTALR